MLHFCCTDNIVAMVLRYLPKFSSTTNTTKISGTEKKWHWFCTCGGIHKEKKEKAEKGNFYLWESGRDFQRGQIWNDRSQKQKKYYSSHPHYYGTTLIKLQRCYFGISTNLHSGVTFCGGKEHFCTLVRTKKKQETSSPKTCSPKNSLGTKGFAPQKEVAPRQHSRRAPPRGRIVRLAGFASPQPRSAEKKSGGRAWQLFTVAS
jgi:hypothetical protein